MMDSDPTIQILAEAAGDMLLHQGGDVGSAMDIDVRKVLLCY